MGVKYQDLEEMCETLGYKLREYNDRINKASGEITDSDIAIVDKLTHAIKSIKTTMAMMEADDYGYSTDDGMTGRSTRYAHGNNMSSARGRYAKRDSMGRYSRSRGYSRDDGNNEEIVEQLREIMQDAGDEKTRAEFEKMIRKLESM